MRQTKVFNIPIPREKTKKKSTLLSIDLLYKNTCMDILFLFILIYKIEGSFDLMILFHIEITYKLQRTLICQSNACKEASWFKKKLNSFQ